MALGDAEIAMGVAETQLLVEGEAVCEIVLEGDGAFVDAGLEIIVGESVEGIAAHRRGAVVDPRDAVVGIVILLLVEIVEDDARGSIEAESERGGSPVLQDRRDEGVVTLAKNRPFLVKFAPTSGALTC